MALVLPQISVLHYLRRPNPLSPESHLTQFNCICQLSNPKSTQLPQNSNSPSSPYRLPLPHQITRLCNSNRLNKALTLLLDDHESVNSRSDPTEKRDAIRILLLTCTELKEIAIGRRIHKIVSKSPEFRDDPLLNAILITMYSLCGFPADSRAVFDRLPATNLLVWNAIVGGYSKNGLHREVITLFLDLISSTELTPDNFTLPCVIKACGRISQTSVSNTVHGMAVKLGLVSDLFVANALLSMYGKLGFLSDAVKVFVKMPERNLVTWNSILSTYLENGCYENVVIGFLKMLEEGLLFPDAVTMVTVLPACTRSGDTVTAITVHGLAVKLGLDQDPPVANALIDMYSKCGFLFEADLVFAKLKRRNVVSWNSMIGRFSRTGDSKTAFAIIRRMQVPSDEVTILNALPACSDESALPPLKELHGYSLRRGFNRHELIRNALISAYANCNGLNYAEAIFSSEGFNAVNSWNALINGYIQHGDLKRGLSLFRCMTSASVGPDCYSLESALSTCQQLRLLNAGKEIHGFVLKKALEQDLYISSSLLTFYFRCGKWVTAEALFDRMANRNRNSVSWNAMISGYLRNELPDKAVEAFRLMLLEGIEPCEVLVTTVLSVCSELPSLRLGKEVHGFALKKQLVNEMFVSCSAIDMYAKCGSIAQSRRVFDTLDMDSKRDVAPWNVMITGHAIHGRVNEAIQLFHEMQVKPDAFTFTGLLMACSHAGLVDEGLAYFTEMGSFYGVSPRREHYACVVDMLGRAGRLDEALEVIETMPEEPDAKMWSSLLSSCRLHGDLDLGGICAGKLMELEPEKAKNYVSVSNLMAQSGKWDDVRSLRKKMRDMGSVKAAGCSWIEVEGRIHYFTAGEDSLDITAIENIDSILNNNALAEFGDEIG